MAGGRGGRKQDRARGEAIVGAAIEVLAEVGYDAMTMDLVAARARAGKATLYRRWASKNELVLDAVARIRGDTGTGGLPDTRSLRGDFAALFRVPSAGESDRMLAVMAGLAVMLSRHAELAEAGITAVLEPWIAAHRALMQRAVDRGEIPADAAIDLIAPVAPTLVAFRLLVARRPFDRDELLAIIDHVVIPALHAPKTSGGRPSPIPAARDRPPDSPARPRRELMSHHTE